MLKRTGVGTQTPLPMLMHTWEGNLSLRTMLKHTRAGNMSLHHVLLCIGEEKSLCFVPKRTRASNLSLRLVLECIPPPCVGVHRGGEPVPPPCALFLPYSPPLVRKAFTLFLSIGEEHFDLIPLQQ